MEASNGLNEGQNPEERVLPLDVGSSSSLVNDSEGHQMSTASRWDEAALHARAKLGKDAAIQGKNDVRSRWKRAVFLANRLANGRGVVTSSQKYDVKDPKSAKAKILETQHWLELIDFKHRYGSNLKFYFRAWDAAETRENFFYWLDHGEAKDLDLEKCPRTRLESERIIYLSSEQRLNYLTRIDEQGRLRWVKSSELVDTTPNRWKDAGDGQGIVPTDGMEDDRLPTSEIRRRASFDTLSVSEEDVDDELSDRKAKSKPRQIAHDNLTIRGLAEKGLRKTLKKNTWIYVCDTELNMFIGIKQTGAFQHSSFFGGSVSSAGLLTVKDGVVTSLTPHSGHYRTDIPYFEAFIKAISERGLDLHKVSITKEEAILWGLQHWGKFNKQKGAFMRSKKEQVVQAGKIALHMVSPGRVKRMKKPAETMAREMDDSGQETPEIEPGEAQSNA